MVENSSTNDEEISLAMSRLGWLSTYSRQFMIARELLRGIGHIDTSFDPRPDEAKLLELLRVGIFAICGCSKERKGAFSAPYRPSDYPQEHFLSFYRKERIFSVMCDSDYGGALTSRLWESDSVLAEFHYDDTEREVFLEDVEQIRQGVRLNTKEIGDRNCDRVFELPLWRGRVTTSEQKATDLFARLTEKSELTWGFWNRWYRGFTIGRPINKELQTQIALIPDEVWDAGAEAVAERIAEIEAEFKTRVAPRLVRDERIDKFRVEDDPLPPGEVAEFICQTVEISLKTALDGSGANGFDETSPEAIQIRGTLDAPTKSVSVLAVGFYQACLNFNSRIGDIYPEDASLINLKNILWTATEELAELDEQARVRCARLAALETKRPVDPPDRQMIAEVPDMVGGELNDEARAIVESDVERILTEEKPSKFVRARFTNWMSTISIWMDRGMKAEKKAKWLADLVSRLRDWWSNAPPS